MPILKDFEYHSPGSLKEALRLLGSCKKPMLLAGGTFAVNTLRKSASYPTDVISLKNITSLKGISRQKEGIVIGPMTTLSEIALSDLVGKSAPALSRAAQKAGTEPIRNMATIGGNLASRFYWVDLPAVLMSLRAKLELVSTRGKKLLGVEDFLKDRKTQGILSRIIIPPASEGCAGFYFRHTRSMEVDIPLFAMAFSIKLKNETIADACICVNTAVSFPIELKNLGSFLAGKKPKDINLTEAKAYLREDISAAKLDESMVSRLEMDLEEALGRSAA